MEDNFSKHLVYGPIWFNNVKALGLQNTWVGRNRNKKTEENSHFYANVDIFRKIM